MECPRCKKDTSLWFQKITRDEWDRSYNVRKNGVQLDPSTVELENGSVATLKQEGMKVLLCDLCKEDWISISSLFASAWWKAKRSKVGNLEMLSLYQLFLNHPNYRKKSERWKFAILSVALVTELSFREAKTIGFNLVTKELYLETKEHWAWTAGFLDGAAEYKGSKTIYGLEISIEDPHLEPLERLKDMIGGTIIEKEPVSLFTATRFQAKKALARIEPYLKCHHGSVPEELLKEEKLEGALSRRNHPKEVSDEDMVMAWLAGYFDACGNIGVGHINVHSRCEYAVKVFRAFFGGSVEKDSDLFLWTADLVQYGPALWEKVGYFSTRRTQVAEDALDVYASYCKKYHNTNEGNVFLLSMKKFIPTIRLAASDVTDHVKENEDSECGGEDRAPGMAESLPTRALPHPRTESARSNGSQAGSTPAGVRKPTPSPRFATSPKLSKGNAPSSVRGSAEPEVEPMYLTMTRETETLLEGKADTCFVCRRILVSALESERRLLDDKDMSVHSKLTHLFLEFETNPMSECPACHENVSLRSWSEGFEMCKACMEGEKKVVESPSKEEDKGFLIE